MVFIQESYEVIVDISLVLIRFFDLASTTLSNGLTSLEGVVTGVVSHVGRCFYLVYKGGEYCLSNAGFFFNLLGSSVVLLVNLIPRTLLLLLSTAQSLARQAVDLAGRLYTSAVGLLLNASPELYLGMAVGTISVLVLARLCLRTVRENNITWEVAATALLRLLCVAYVFLIRSIARTIGLVFRVVEVTISNLRIPMFAHAGE